MKRGCGFLFALVFLGGAAAPVLAYDNSPYHWKVLPEVVWAPATGGGTWVTQVQIIDMEGAGTSVSVIFNHKDGFRGPLLLWTSPGALSSLTIPNIMETLQGLDPSFTYYGKAGGLSFNTQGTSNMIHVTAKIYNGDYAKTFPGLSYVQSNRLDIGITEMVIPNVSNNATYRTSIGYTKLSNAAGGILVTIYDYTGAVISSGPHMIPAGRRFDSWNPFTDAGLPYPQYSFSNCWIQLSGFFDGTAILPYGALANNTTNDPSAIIAVQRH